MIVAPKGAIVVRAILVSWACYTCLYIREYPPYIREYTVSTITGSNIDLFQLIAWKNAIKLEMLGMHRRGRSCLSIVKDAFGLKKSTPAGIVLEIVVLAIEEMKDEH